MDSDRLVEYSGDLHDEAVLQDGTVLFVGGESAECGHTYEFTVDIVLY
jgi:hypothetical protein